MSFLDAAVCSETKIQAHLVNTDEEKMSALRAILAKAQDASKRIAIACNDYESATATSDRLLRMGFPCVCPSEDPILAAEALARWARDPEEYGSPLLATDLAFAEVPGCADVLVHLELPDSSKRMFSDRFEHLRRSMKSPFMDATQGKAECHILMRGDECSKVRTIRGLFSACGQALPAEVEECFERVLKKKRLPLCHGLKTRSRCQVEILDA